MKYLNACKLVFLFSFFLIFSACKDDNTSPGEQVDVHIIMGQSNSLGVGHAYQLPKEMREPQDSCYIFNKASGKYEIIQAGVNTQSQEGMFGPVVKAAQLLRDHQKKEVYFIVVGFGNSQLFKSNESEIQDWHPESNELLPFAKSEIERARKALEASGKTPVFKTLSWWQGEADGTYSEKANVYLENETAFFAALDQVSYLANTKRIIFKVFEDVAAMPHGHVVNTAKIKRASTDSRTVSIIETNSYDRIPQDKLHATAKGQLQAGTDLFNAIKKL
ncbi:sialate O-acetylesterase [Pontibacter qinzhouensis]|uniref:Sialate O-acetylesterase n=1 Tax=Pontibacter qinzhouensis TaxID=2603253 RepID=A0A5C8IQG3_9BACT|nr:sialate O-acetylesterase [Pontibacter qinzhouensis]TXK23460.1 sialate O-acetylesterase [Pontibacter qinzhouensis]